MLYYRARKKRDEYEKAGKICFLTHLVRPFVAIRLNVI